MASPLTQNITNLQSILDTVNALPEAGGVDPVLQDKTVTPTTSVQSITADAGYDGLDTVTVNAMPTATQATPSITINASGLITATATQASGYVTAGTMSATKQLAFQAAKTITPTTTSQTAVSSGYYTGGAITVKGDSNLVAGNIKSGVSIFGVNGTYAGSGGSGGGNEDVLITRTLTSYTNNTITNVGNYAFADCSNLISVNLPVATSIGSCAFFKCACLTSISLPVATSIDTSAFAYCIRLVTVSFPAAKSIGYSAFAHCNLLVTVSFPAAISIVSNAFAYCYKLTSISLPAATSIGNYAFSCCSSLASVNFPKVTYIGSSAFAKCLKLTSLNLGASTVCSLANSGAFSSTPIGGYSTSAGKYGSIYVPTSLLTSYQTATNWTYFSSRMVGY